MASHVQCHADDVRRRIDFNDSSDDSSVLSNGRKESSQTRDKDDMKENGDQSSNKKCLMIVFISLILDLLAFTIILPLLPSILDYYDKHDTGGSFHKLKSAVGWFGRWVGVPEAARWNSVLFGGMLGSLFSFLQFFSSPLAGAASDVYGRKAVMLITCIGVTLSYGVWAMSSSFSVFVLARVIGGVSKCNVSVSTAVVSDVTPQPKQRTHGMALIGIAYSLGFLIGPMIGAYFSMRARLASASDTEGAWPFYVAPALLALTLSVINILFISIFMKESLPKHQRCVTLGGGLKQAVILLHPVKLFRFSAVKSTTKSDMSMMQSIGWIYFLYLFLYSGLEFTLTFLTHTRFSFTSIQQGKMFLVIGITMILVQGGYSRRIKPGLELSAAYKAVVLLIPSFMLVGFSSNLIMLYAGLVLYSCASAVVVPCLTTRASSYGGVDQKGTVLGIFRSLGALARSLGPIASSTVYWSMGPEFCYVIGGLGLIVPLIMLQRIRKVQA